jgi:predicted nucleic acid-binding protein
MTIFVDNDVILDVLLDRKEFKDSKLLLSSIENKQAKAYTSPLILTNSFYIISKLKDKKRAWSAIKKIRLLFKIAKVTEDIVDLALASDFIDFEDAVQYYAALAQKADYLITRNKKQYTGTQIPVVTPLEYIAIAAQK